ncbi:MAG: hypothetical protein RSD76_08490 [Clostridia bacterium]
MRGALHQTLLHLLTPLLDVAVGLGCMALNAYSFRFTFLHLLTPLLGAAVGLECMTLHM